MSTFRCPNCDDDHQVFGSSGVTDEFDARVLAQLPIHPDFNSEQADGPVVRDEDSPVREDLVAFRRPSSTVWVR